MTDINGLIVWDEDQIKIRESLIELLSVAVRRGLLSTNPAWKMIRIDSPVLMSTTDINKNYTSDDYYSVGNLSLRPETTAGSYKYIKSLLKSHLEKWLKPPVCIWQAGKSFRKEQNQPEKFCRYKEFYQIEFQCIYSADSKCDYHSKMVEYMKNHVSRIIRQEVKVIESDRLPEYSSKTTDLEILYRGRWMEIASISKRTDFDNENIVLEIAMGLDRLVRICDIWK